MPYGWRMVRAWFFGVILACMWAIPIWTRFGTFREPHKPIVYFPKMFTEGTLAATWTQDGATLGMIETIPTTCFVLIPIVGLLLAPRSIRPKLSFLTPVRSVFSSVAVAVAIGLLVVGGPSTYDLLRRPLSKLIVGNGELEKTLNYDDGSVKWKQTAFERDDGELIHRRIDVRERDREKKELIDQFEYKPITPKPESLATEQIYRRLYLKNNPRLTAILDDAKPNVNQALRTQAKLAYEKDIEHIFEGIESREYNSGKDQVGWISDHVISKTPRLDSAKYLTSASWYFGINNIPTFFLLLTPPLLCHKLEKLKEAPGLRRWFLSGRGGSARWAGPTSLSKHEKQDDRGIYLGSSIFDDDFSTREISVKDDSHMLTIGAPGSGKSVTSIWPNLLTYHGSAIVIDPKGEHAKMTLGTRQDRHMANVHNRYRHSYPDVEPDEFTQKFGTDTLGHSNAKPIPGSRSWVLDPYGIVSCYKSARYNVLSEIDLSNSHARSMISAISRSCITVGEGENKFWEESACQVLDGAIAHVLSKYPEDRRTLPEVADLLLGLDAQTGFADPDRLRETLIDMRMNQAAGGLPQRAAMLFDNLGEKAYGNITAELLNALKWCTDPAMRINLTASDFTFEQICSEGINTVYIAIPLGAMKEQSRWLRCVSEIAMQSAIRRREKYARPNPPVLFVLDELPQYGKKLNGIKEGVVTLRDAGVKLWAFVQNYSQLVECFGEEGATNFESGSTIQVYGVYDTKTAEWISAKLGSHGIKRKSWQRIWILFLPITVKKEETQLVEVSEITQELQKGSRLQYVFSGSGRPMRLERKPFKGLEIDGAPFYKMKGCPAADEHLRA